MGVRIATAGWAIPRAVAEAFPREGTGLARYSARLRSTEINSTFYRSHRPSTWARWAADTPDDFRFAVKAPKAITHEARLVGADGAMTGFLAEVALLGSKLGPLLVQLPPSLAFERAVAGTFFAGLRDRFAGPVACEPRHATWFEPEANALLAELRIARVAADPVRAPGAGLPGGAPELAYYRLHGSPQMYRSSYGEEALADLAGQLAAGRAAETWCVFDNTTSGAAAANALTLASLLSSP